MSNILDLKVKPTTLSVLDDATLITKTSMDGYPVLAVLPDRYAALGAGVGFIFKNPLVARKMARAMLQIAREMAAKEKPKPA